MFCVTTRFNGVSRKMATTGVKVALERFHWFTESLKTNWVMEDEAKGSWGALDTELWGLILTQVSGWQRGIKSEDYPRLSIDSVKGIQAVISCSKSLRERLCSDELLWKVLCDRWFGSSKEQLLPSYSSWCSMFMVNLRTRYLFSLTILLSHGPLFI